MVDVLSSLPYSTAIAAYEPHAVTNTSSTSIVHLDGGLLTIEWLGMLRMMRIGRLARKPFAGWLAGNHTMRVPYLVALFTLLAHWCGLCYYVIAIAPLEADPQFDTLHPYATRLLASPAACAQLALARLP